MTDPFSVASGAIGVVSLGLTVCDGLISYFSAFKGQDQFLSSLSERAEHLNKSLHLLNQALPPLRTRTPDVARQIGKSLAECGSGILALQTKVAAFQRVHGPSLRRDSLHHAARKAIFPFKKDALVELLGTIDSLQQNLETVLAIANLEATSVQLNIQNVVNDKVNAVITLSNGIRAGVQNVSQDISLLRNDFSAFKSDLGMVKSALDPGLQAVIQRIDHLSGQVAMMQVSHATSRANFQSVARSLQQQLIAKPSLFHQFCVEAKETKITTKPRLPFQETFSSICTCHYSARRQKAQKQVLSFEYSRYTAHEPHCPFHVEDIKQRRLQFKFSCCSMLISRSLRVMAGLTSGAGGYSLSAQVAWIPMVSYYSSLAFRLIYRLKIDLLSTTNACAVLETDRLDLLKLVAKGKAHPRETDELWGTLLEV
ncbi:hypothetical protein CLCR_01564 [Cladophialophora carrionii]|uniref:Fungal N-terminal domain-containing protein n=1 Tax=Cladophialophora carrionii TaxID=86049 RepID=A0A1C1CAW5_9EURO|nr:hypothetical protein CLCR_01564 [Cladophialophora carrionii]